MAIPPGPGTDEEALVTTHDAFGSLAAAYVSPAVRDAQAFGDPSVSAGEEPL